MKKYFRKIIANTATAVAIIGIAGSTGVQAAQDWAAIEAAARKEGKVVIYSVSSRIFKLVDKFKEKYGVEIEGHDIASDVQLEKLRREHKAGIYNVDVIFNQESSLVLNEFLPGKMVANFVPDTVAGDLDGNEKDPLLIQRWSSRVLVYNKAKNPDAEPIDNLWDLIRPEWKSRVLMPNPIEDSVQANVIQTILDNPAALEAAYEKEFGKKIEYSKKVLKAVKKNPMLDEPTAAMEWLYQLLNNDPVFQGSTTKIFNNIADVKQDNPPIGFTTFSKLRKNKKDVYHAEPLYGVEPAFGVAYPTVLAIADKAPHPNAAKLLIRYMMEDGFKAWNVVGDYAARESVGKKQVEKYGIPTFGALKLWKVDPIKVYDSKYTFLQLYLALK